MSAEQHKAIVRRMVEEAWNRGELALIDEVVAADHVIHYLPQLPPGPEGFRLMVMGSRAAFPDGTIAVQQMLAEDDLLAVRWRFTGTQRGELMGIPPTGRSVTITGITLIRFRDGKMVERWEESDALGLLQQLGVAPAPSQPAGASA